MKNHLIDFTDVRHSRRIFRRNPGLAVAAVVALGAALALWRPAARAMRLEPAEALRID